jgi:hypothetical protein
MLTWEWKLAVHAADHQAQSPTTELLFARSALLHRALSPSALCLVQLKASRGAQARGQSPRCYLVCIEAAVGLKR